jgi:hypothetical protein
MMQVSKVYGKRAGSRLLAWIILSVSLLGAAQVGAYSGAGYAPEDVVPMREGETIALLAQRVLPEGAELIHEPQVVDFGADIGGVLLIFRQDRQDRAVWIWYLAPQHARDRYHKVIVKSPEPMDAFFDLQVNRVFNVGPEGARDLVLLEVFSRPVIAGGEQHVGGSVYRRIQQQAEYLEAASEALDGVTTEAQAKDKLAPWIPRIPPPKPQSLIDDFLNAPLDYLPATRLERWEMIKPESPRLLVMDTRNGYARIAGDGGLPGYELGLFRDQDQGYVFALQTQWTQGQTTVFLKREANRWVDVSRNILPDYEEDKAYEIPHVGRDLKLLGADGRVEKIYRWNGQRFAPVTPAPAS